MHEQAKLEEAEFFLGKLVKAEHDEPAVYTHYVSAFLSAGRSVIQYALKEMKGSTALLCSQCKAPVACGACGTLVRKATPSPGLKWYGEFCKERPAFPFMRRVRNTNIHHEPIRPNKALLVDLLDKKWRVTSSAPGGSVTVDSITDKNGNAIPFKATVCHRFTNWEGPGDVTDLCSRYLDDLKVFVAEARSLGFISTG